MEDLEAAEKIEDILYRRDKSIKRDWNVSYGSHRKYRT